MYNYSDLSETQLVISAQNGDNRALEYLIKIYQGLLHFIVEKYFLKDGEKDDLIQEATIGLLEAVQDYRVECGKKFKNFAIMCITREIDSCIKKSNRKKHQILNDAIPIYAFAEGEEEKVSGGYQKCIDKFLKDENQSPEDVVLENEAIKELMRKINSVLSDMEKQVLKLRINGHSYNEITIKLDLQNKSVDNAIQRIRRKMQSDPDYIRTA